MKTLEPKFVALHGSVARLDQQLACNINKLPSLDGVVMSITTPSITLETTDHGITYSPAESVEVWGSDNLYKLAQAILEFCDYNKLMVEQRKAGKQGSVE